MQLVFLVGAARLLAGLWLGFRPFDDTYITFRYALNLSSGAGFLYNAQEPVLGTTTVLWTLILAGIGLAGIPIEIGSIAVALTLDIASALLMCRLMQRLGYSRSACLASPLLFLAIFDYLSLARSGMEVSLFVCLIMATLAALAERRFMVAAFGASLATLARPEGVILIGVLGLMMARRYRRGEAAGVWKPAAIVTLILGAWSAYAIWRFGSPIPQSLLAKAAMEDPDLRRFSWTNIALFFLKGQHGEGPFVRTYLQLTPLLTGLSAVGAISAAAALRERTSQSIDRALLLWAFPILYVGGLSAAHAFTFFAWYYGPIYPFLAMTTAAGTAVLARGREHRVITGTCALLVAGQIVAAVIVKQPADRSFWVDGYLRVSDLVPREERVVVAAPEIGAVGWRVWPARVLDLEGLVTPAAVGVAPDSLIESVRPDYLIIRTDNAAELMEALRLRPWFAAEYQLVRSEKDPYANRSFQTYKRR